MGEKIYFYCLLVFALISTTNGISFKAKSVKGTLPLPVSYAKPIYDGEGSIYIFGGGFNDPNSGGSVAGTTQILRYDIAADSVEEVGQLPTPGYMGSVQMVENAFYYFGGRKERYSKFKDIVRFDPATGVAESVGMLPEEMYDNPYLTTFKEKSASKVHLLLRIQVFGIDSVIYEFDPSTDEIRNVTDPFRFTAFTSIVVGNNAYAFGGEQPVLKVDMNSIGIEMLSDAPRLHAGASAASDGQNVYIIGGYDTELPGVLGDYIFQYNLENQEWTSLQVENFPYHDDVVYDYAPSSGFVEDLNRIYYFGGRTRNLTSNEYIMRDDIWYIDLNTKQKI